MGAITYSLNLINSGKAALANFFHRLIELVETELVQFSGQVFYPCLRHGLAVGPELHWSTVIVDQPEAKFSGSSVLRLGVKDLKLQIKVNGGTNLLVMSVADGNEC